MYISFLNHHRGSHFLPPADLVSRSDWLLMAKGYTWNSCVNPIATSLALYLSMLLNEFLSTCLYYSLDNVYILLVAGANMMQRLHCELQDAIMRLIPDCGHLPHVDKPSSVAKLIAEFSLGDCH